MQKFIHRYIIFVLLLGILSGCGKKTRPIDTSIEITSSQIVDVSAVTLDTLYGTFIVDEPVLLEVLASQAIQRLKRINQHGINDVIKTEYAFSRYDHSVGVFLLTRMFGGSLEEQVAALLHDVSHTVFSHVGDLVFAAATQLEANHAYQDDIHDSYIEQTDLAPILRKYDMRHVVSDEAKDRFKRLEQEYPDICADRLDYQLRTAHIAGLLSSDEVCGLLQHLHFENDMWFFDTVEHAHAFGIASEWLTRNIYAAPYNHYLYKFAAEAFKRAMHIDLVTAHELHFSTDDIIWDRIIKSDDVILQSILHDIYHYEAGYIVSDASDYDLFKKSKCRVVDPLVKVGGECVRLSQADQDFAQRYADIQKICSRGVYIKFNSTKG